MAPRVRDGQEGRPARPAGRILRSHRAGICARIARGEGVECRFFHQKRKYLFLGEYKYWTMTECPDIDLDADDYALNRALLYRDRRDFVIQQGDTGTREE